MKQKMSNQRGKAGRRSAASTADGHERGSALRDGHWRSLFQESVP